MPHFQIETDDDGRVLQILRDGQPHAAVKLEQLYSIVILYFQLAATNLQRLESEQDETQRRAFGVQSFLMSLTGLEALTNTYFKLRGQELGSQEVVDRLGQRHGSLTKKIAELLAMTPERLIDGQDQVLDELFRLSGLRNQLVHAQWEPASLTLAGSSPITITGAVRNFQADFEDPGLCRSAFMWCLLLVARVGRARGSLDVAAFVHRWTGIHGWDEKNIMAELGLP